jgi:hypothetical protein
MASHQFAVGQVVIFARGRPDIMKGEQFQVARHLPAEGTTPQYRIKSEWDGHERICREDELGAAPPEAWAGPEI